MTWKEKTIIRILLIVAKIIAPQEWRDEVEHLINHVSYAVPEVKHE